MPNPDDMVIKTAKTYVNVIQQYSNMYYHFVSEIFPRVIIAKPYLDQDPEAKILIWDTPYVRSYLEEIGISAERIEAFDPFVRYAALSPWHLVMNNSIGARPLDATLVKCVKCRYFANRMIYPTPTPRITPCKESLELTRKALNVQTLPESERNLIVYLSRNMEVNRQVSEEEQLLESLHETFPGEEV